MNMQHRPPVTVTLRKIGNSEGVILPKEVLERFGIKSGDTLELSESDDGLHLKVGGDDGFAEKMELARKFMDRYKVALKKLAE